MSFKFHSSRIPCLLTYKETESEKGNRLRQLRHKVPNLQSLCDLQTSSNCCFNRLQRLGGTWPPLTKGVMGSTPHRQREGGGKSASLIQGITPHRNNTNIHREAYLLHKLVVPSEPDEPGVWGEAEL